MSDIVDLTVNRWCESVYALQEEVEDAPPVDVVSRIDYIALQIATRRLHEIVSEKLSVRA